MKKRIILYIDTTKRDNIIVLLFVNGKKKTLEENSMITKADDTLFLIKKLLQIHGLKLEDLSEIKVNRGPGSFIGLRVGITIANTLAFLLDIPVNGGKPPILPIYQ